MGSSNAYTSGVPPFSPGDPLSASALEKMREADQRSLPQRSLGAFVKQTPGGTMVSPVQRRRSSAAHPFRVFDASDDEGLKVILQYGSVIDVSNWRNPQVIDPQIDGKSLIPDPESEERPRLSLPEEGEKIFVFVVIALNESGQIDTPQSEEDPSPVTIQAANEEELADKFAQPNKIFVHVARIEVGTSEGEDEERYINRIDQILGSHILWPQKAVHPFQVFDASDGDGLQISVAYGAVIDMMDWQNPVLHIPKIGVDELKAGIFETMPKLPISENTKIYVVIKQGNNGEVAEGGVEIQALTEPPEDSGKGTLYVQVAEISVGGSEEKKSLSIKQILGSHIVWPFKPDFLGWRQKKETAASALWLGSESPYAEDADILSDLFIQVQREDFDNGRDGNQVFALRMEEGESIELTLDKDNQRGLAAVISDSLTKLELDRKNTAGAGVTLQSSGDEASCTITGPNEGPVVRTIAESDQSRIEMNGGESTLKAKCTGQDPSLALQGQGTTKVTTVSNKVIIMREITYMESPTTMKRAYFLCSEPEEEYNPAAHHSDHDAHGDHHSAHHSAHHTGHYDPNHDSNHSGHHTGHDDPNHDSNHSGYHTAHHAGHDDPNHDSNHSAHHAGHNDDDHGDIEFHHNSHHSEHSSV